MKNMKFHISIWILCVIGIYFAYFKDSVEIGIITAIVWAFGFGYFIKEQVEE